MKPSSFISSGLVLLLGLVAAPAAHALVVSVSGPGLIIGAPTSVGDADNTNNTSQQGFSERQGVTLVGPLNVDGGAIAAGTTVDSHMIFFNRSGSGDRLTTVATWGFSGAILGVMSDNNGNLEAASNGLLGAPGTSYPGSFGNRGMESADSYLALTPTTLRVEMNINQPGDWIRVVTRSSSSVPDGGNVGILSGLALLALCGLRRATRR